MDVALRPGGRRAVEWEFGFGSDEGVEPRMVRKWLGWIGFLNPRWRGMIAVASVEGEEGGM